MFFMVTQFESGEKINLQKTQKQFSTEKGFVKI